MANELSSYSEEYLARIVAAGIFPSKEAALEAAVAALREKTEPLPLVPPEHMDLVEQALASSHSGYPRPFTAADWERLRQLARDTAAGVNKGQQ